MKKDQESLEEKEKSSTVAWFVGAMYGGSDDQLDRFIREGIWENGYDDKY